jgi:Protein of unknown function DUF58
VVAASLTAVGWILVIRELMVIGIAVGLVMVLALVSVWIPAGNSLQFTRSFATRGIHSGDTVRVDLAAQGRWTPTLSIQERLPYGRSITASLAGKGRTLSFETPPLQRGLNLIGPTIARRTDFFGLVQRTSSKANPSPLIVWPARTGVDALALRRLLIDPSAQPRIGVMKPGRPVAAFEGDLRAYVPGDEPRRIHWPSTARTGNLVVRTDASIVSDNRFVLIIDLDTAHHHVESFELLLGAATSLVLALLPVPSGSLHREDSFDDDLVVEVLEGEHSPTPGRNRFRYPELLLDRLALATFTASAQSKASAPSRSSGMRGGLLLGGPSSNFVGASIGIQCGESQSGILPSGAVLQLRELGDLAQLIKFSARSSRSAQSRSPQSQNSESSTRSTRSTSRAPTPPSAPSASLTQPTIPGRLLATPNSPTGAP